MKGRKAAGSVWELEMYYVYFLELSNGNVYKGSTGDLKQRYSDHQCGKVKSTRLLQPVVLIGYEAYRLKSDAQRRERFLKTTEGRRLFRRQYKNVLNVSTERRRAREVE